jgi:hypothetical protein
MTAQDSQDEFLNVDSGTENATPVAAAIVLEAVAETLREAPNNRRYDVHLEVEER